jgi:hypothetical protein
VYARDFLPDDAASVHVHVRGGALSSDEAYRKLGISYDSRDYDACFLLLRHHLSNSRVQMIMNSPSSLVKKTEYAAALKEQQALFEKLLPNLPKRSN